MGMPVSEITTIIFRSEKTIRSYIHAYENVGISGLIPNTSRRRFHCQIQLDVATRHWLHWANVLMWILTTWRLQTDGAYEYELHEDEEYTADTFFNFLNKVLEAYPSGNITMVLDNAWIHHAKLLEPFLDENKRLKFVFLPPYILNSPLCFFDSSNIIRVEPFRL